MFASLFSAFSSKTPAATMDVAQLRNHLDAGEVTLLVDVRSPAEFKSGHVPGAVNIPLQRIGQATELAAHRDATIHLICQSGARSGRAQSLLARQGFSTINILGGTGAWRYAGLPTV